MELTPTKAPPTRLPPPLHPGTKLPKINTVKVRENVINVSRDRARKLGQDVTIEAQDIFDALSKTYPCAWDGSNIIVLGEVRIEPPYTTEKVTAESSRGPEPSGGKSIGDTVERVKKVLEGERKKMNAAGKKDDKSAPVKK
jgi:hypothetical protein